MKTTNHVSSASKIDASSIAVDQALLTAAKAEKEALIRTLLCLVGMESGSTDKIGIEEMNYQLERELKDLGFSVTRHPNNGSNGGLVGIGDNLVGVLKGNGGKNIMLQAHQDTVYPRDTIKKSPFYINGDFAYGPGIADDKGGIAVILHSLKLLKDRDFKDFGSITVLFNTDEEQSSVGSKDLITSTAELNDYILSFEPTTINPEGLILGTSGVGTARVKITGKAAHAGAEPEKGVNALIEAADLILRTADLDQGPNGLRFNWTMAEGGEARNALPAHASLLADIRFPTNELFDAFKPVLEARVANQKLADTKIELLVDITRPAFDVTADSKLLIDKAVEIYKSIGHNLVVIPKTGGGTDAAFAALSGKPVIEALGLPGTGYHSNNEEYVNLEAIPRRLYLTSKLIMLLAQGK
ncbi:glutamate carboxypeptidase [Orbus wheelerorum]|uniref:glutamate carboxypeptidase n=1 Tax=Orbus wheelerorum TaxID=3074111 RepID=UPI00370D13A6